MTKGIGEIINFEENEETDTKARTDLIKILSLGILPTVQNPLQIKVSQDIDYINSGETDEDGNYIASNNSPFSEVLD